MGVNVAKLQGLDYVLYSKEKVPCVFISYKSEDHSKAEAIGTYLTDEIGIDIYLDEQDLVLKEAVSTENDKKIVDAIRRGLEKSTHLLCVVSDKTRLSWWVPYEIAIAEDFKLDIASLQLKEVDDVPSFLKIHDILSDLNEFLRYCCKFNTYGLIYPNLALEEIRRKDSSLIQTYLN